MAERFTGISTLPRTLPVIANVLAHSRAFKVCITAIVAAGAFAISAERGNAELRDRGLRGNLKLVFPPDPEPVLGKPTNSPPDLDFEAVANEDKAPPPPEDGPPPPVEAKKLPPQPHVENRILQPQNAAKLFSIQTEAGAGNEKMEISPDGKFFFVLNEHVAKIWDIQTGEEIKLEGINGPPCQVNFSPDGRTCALTVGRGGFRTYLLDTQNGFADITGKEPLRHTAEPITFTPEGNIIFVSDGLNELDPTTGSLNQFQYETKDAKHFETTSIAVFKDRMATTDADGFLRIWDRKNRKVTTVVQNGGSGHAAFDPSGTRIATSFRARNAHKYDPEVLRVWDSEKFELAGEMRFYNRAQKIEMDSATTVQRFSESHTSGVLENLKMTDKGMVIDTIHALRGTRGFGESSPGRTLLLIRDVMQKTTTLGKDTKEEFIFQNSASGWGID